MGCAASKPLAASEDGVVHVPAPVEVSQTKVSQLQQDSRVDSNLELKTDSAMGTDVVPPQPAKANEKAANPAKTAAFLQLISSPPEALAVAQPAQASVPAAAPVTSVQSASHSSVSPFAKTAPVKALVPAVFTKPAAINEDTVATYRKGCGTLSDEVMGIPYPNYFMGPPKPPCDAERCETLSLLDYEDPGPDPEIGHIVSLITNIFRVPAVLVAMLDSERIYIKNARGFMQGDFPWRWSFCAWTLQKDHPEVMVIQDSHLDARFRDNKYVQGEPQVRTYVGTPLIASNGHRLGTLCFVVFKNPRRVTAQECNILNNMAELVVRELERDKQSLLQRKASKQLQQGITRAADCFKERTMLVDLRQDKWQIMHVNNPWCNTTNIKREEAVGTAFWDLFEMCQSMEKPWEAFKEEADKGQDFILQGLRRKGDTGTLNQYKLLFRPATKEAVDEHTQLIGIPGSVESADDESTCLYFASLKPYEGRSSMDTASSMVGVPKGCPFQDVELGPLLGKGSFGRVYRGTWNGQLVAVKVIDAPAVLRGNATEGNPFEAVLGMDLSHPNIIRTFKYTAVKALDGRSKDGSWPDAGDTGSAEGFRGDSAGSYSATTNKEHLATWLILEYCNRGSLQSAITQGWFRAERSSKHPAPNLNTVLSTGYEIASALRALHEKDVIHGDLSGGNVLLTEAFSDERKFRAKIADFGLARGINVQEVIQTQTYGTVSFMPPELLATGAFSKAVDVYSFGVLLWEMYNGVGAWAGFSHAQIINAVAIHNRRLQFPDDAPKKFVELAMMCTDPDPEKRPTFATIVPDLAELKSSLA